MRLLVGFTNSAPCRLVNEGGRSVRDHEAGRRYWSVSGLPTSPSLTQ